MPHQPFVFRPGGVAVFGAIVFPSPPCLRARSKPSAWGGGFSDPNAQPLPWTRYFPKVDPEVGSDLNRCTGSGGSLLKSMSAVMWKTMEQYRNTGLRRRWTDAAILHARAAAAQNCGINCAQIATVPMNSVIDANVAASSMKIFNIAGLPRTQAPAFQISVSAIVPVGNCNFQKIGSGSVNVWLKVSTKVRRSARPPCPESGPADPPNAAPCSELGCRP